MTGKPLINSRGWPRPVHEGLPMAYTSDTRHGVGHSSRQAACALEHRCGVCGLDLPSKQGDKIYVGQNHTAVGRQIWMTDDVMMHERCAKLTLAHCPQFSSGQCLMFWVLVSDILVTNLGNVKTRRQLSFQEVMDRRLRLKSTRDVTYSSYGPLLSIDDS